MLIGHHNNSVIVFPWTYIHHVQLWFQYIHLDICSRYKSRISIAIDGGNIPLLLLLRHSDGLLPYTLLDLESIQNQIYKE